MLDKLNAALDRAWPLWVRWWWVVLLAGFGITALGVSVVWLSPLAVLVDMLIVLVWSRASVRAARAFVDEWRRQR